MRRVILLFLLLFLVACTQEPEQVIAPTVQVVYTPQCLSHAIGESCVSPCDCLAPGVCVTGICAKTKLEINESCFSNKQCQSGYCTQSGKCGGPDGPNASYGCERKCKHGDCYTSCTYR